MAKVLEQFDQGGNALDRAQVHRWYRRSCGQIAPGEFNGQDPIAAAIDHWTQVGIALM